jgi:hypothetical protein
MQNHPTERDGKHISAADSDQIDLESQPVSAGNLTGPSLVLQVFVQAFFPSFCDRGG